MSNHEMKKKRVAELRQLCRAAGLTAEGLKTELIARLSAVSRATAGFVPGKTKCPKCGSPSRVIRTATHDMGETLLIDRTFLCWGKGRHKFHKQRTQPKKTRAAGI